MSHCIHGCLKGLHAALPERDSITYPILAAASLTTLSLLHFTRLAILRSSKPGPTIPGPSSTVLPLLSPADRSALPYPPDTLPGGRDVASPVCLPHPDPRGSPLSQLTSIPRITVIVANTNFLSMEM